MTDEHRDHHGDGESERERLAPQSDPGDAGPPLNEEGTTTGAGGGEHPHEPEPAAGGVEATPRREQGGL